MKTVNEIEEIKNAALSASGLLLAAEEDRVITLNHTGGRDNILGSVRMNLETGEFENPGNLNPKMMLEIYQATKDYYPAREQKSLIDHVKDLVPAKTYDTTDMDSFEEVEIVNATHRKINGRNKVFITFAGINKMGGASFPANMFLTLVEENSEVYVYDIKKL